LRQFYQLASQWPPDLPAADGNTLLVAGLDASLDALTPTDACQWLETRLKPAILSFQDEYEGQAGLIFWLPSGKERIAIQRASNSYQWRCGPNAANQTIPLSQALFAGAETDAAHIIANPDPQTDLEGKDWIGLHWQRIS
jgi:hypothetical protein